MSEHEQIRQMLLEYVFELPIEAETREIERLITSDPQVARIYAEVRQQADLMAEAARLDMRAIEFTPPKEQLRGVSAMAFTPLVATSRPPSPSPAVAASSPWMSIVLWTLALLGLVAILLLVYWGCRLAGAAMLGAGAAPDAAPQAVCRLP